MNPEFDRSLDESVRLIAEIPAAVALFDRDLRYVAASPLWIGAFALPAEALAGHRHDELCREAAAELTGAQQRALAGESVDGHPIEDLASDPGKVQQILSARPHRGADGTIAGVVAVLREAAGPSPVEAADSPADSLASLADRADLARCLAQALADPDISRRTRLLLAISIDNLRNINTLHGFGVGDQVLRIAAERLVSGTRARVPGKTGGPARERDVVVRLGGACFAVLCGPPAPPPADAANLVTRLLRAMQSPIALDGLSLRLAASIGCLATTAAHAGAEDVLRDLDLALREARASGSNKLVVWEPSLTRTAARGYMAAEQLRRAFDDGELTLHYQPVLSLRDNRMVGAEALLRWNHPSDGLVPSAAFVPVLEESGLIDEVGCWVVREAMRQLESWRTLYGRNIVEWVGINLSARQLDDPAPLVAALRGIHAGGLPVHRLRLEIAEPVLAQKPEAARGLLAELRGLGIGCAVDCFAGGVPFAGPSRTPVDTIKIDGALVGQVGAAAGERLLQAVLQLAQATGAAVIAKGIETAAQRDFLRDNGCGFGQGYLLAEPMDGALLGAFALTHAVAAGGAAAPARGARRRVTPPTSAGPSRAG